MNCNSVNFSFNVFRVIRVIRLFRCVRLIKWIFVFLHQVVRELINNSISSGYDIGIGFVVASDEILAHLDQIVAYKECRIVFKEKITAARREIGDSLGKVRKEFPGIAIAINTKQVTRLILNKGRDATWQLLEDGLVEEFDCALFTKQLEEKMKRLLANPVHWVPPPDAYMIFSTVPWLKDLRDYIINNVARYATHQVYNKGEAFLKKGEIAPGVYLIVSGKARVVHSLEDRTTSKHVDIHRTASIHMACYHKHNDYLGPGSIVGEQSILVNRPRGSYVVCESDLQVYFISAEDMHGLMLKYPVIEENLWRLCSVRMAQSFLSKTKYKTKTFEELKLICEKSLLATLVPETGNGVFEIDESITDVAVIYGELRCFPSNMKVVGPKLVVEGSTKLNLITPCKLLIILKTDYDFDVGRYNNTPTETGKSEVGMLDSSTSLLNEATSQHDTTNIQEPLTVTDMKLSCALNIDPNPKTREEFEKKRRLNHLKEVRKQSASGDNPSSSGTTTTSMIGKESSDSRLTPVENIDLEKKVE